MKYLLLACLILPGIINGQSEWRQLGGPVGASVMSLYTTDNDELVLRTHQRAVLRSNDQGVTWSRLHPARSQHNVFQWMAVGADGTIAVKYDDSELLRMLPGTSEWEELPAASMQPAVITGDGRIVGQVSSSEFATVPAGSNTPEPINNVSGSLLNSSLFEPGPNDDMYFYRGPQIWHYDFETEILTNVYNQGSVTISCLEVHPQLGLYMVVDDTLRHLPFGGEEWTLIPTPPNSNFNFVHVVNSTHLILSNSSGLPREHYQSYDGGASWETSNDLLNTLTPRSLSLSDETIFYYNRLFKGYLFKSAPGSEEVVRIDHPLRVSPAIHFEALDERVFVARNIHSHVQISEDSGISWEYLLIDGQYVNELYHGLENGLVARTLDGRLFLAEHITGAWQVLDAPFNSSTVIYDVALLDHQQILLLTDDHLAHFSSDGGTSWTSISTPVEIGRLEKHPAGYFIGAPALSALFFSSASPVYRFNIDILNWESASFPAGFLVYEMVVSPTGTIFIHAETDDLDALTYFFVSQDNGETFVQRDCPRTDYNFSQVPVSIAANSLDRVFLAVNGEVWTSGDYGATWSFMVDADLGEPIDRQNVFIDKEDYLYYSGNSTALQRLAVTTSLYDHVVSGHVWRDLGSDCVESDDDPAFVNQIIQAQNDSNTYYGYSNWEGNYRLLLPTGDFSVAAIVENPLYQACTEQVNITIEEGGTETIIDFGFDPLISCSLLQISASTPLLRRCFDNIYYVSVCNAGTAIANDAELTIQLDEFFEYTISSLAPTEQTGNTLLFSLGDVDPGQCVEFTLTINVSCEAALGQEHCIEMSILPTNDCAPSFAPSNYIECQENIGSYDPNDKRAFVDGREVTELFPPNVDRLSYHIRFQNTGTDTAFMVIVEDELPEALDPATFRLEASSHPCITDFLPLSNGQTKVVFTFNDILLVDSFTNETASHGFVKFSIAPKAGLAHGTVIPNFADIYFDFNAPIRTNTLGLIYNSPTSTTAPLAMVGVLAYPNPFQEEVLLKFDTYLPPGTRCSWFNGQGQLVAEQQITGDYHQWNTASLPSGMYWYQLHEAKRGVMASGKIVKQ